MRRTENSIPFVQIKELVDAGHVIQIEHTGHPTEYEVTLFRREGHRHFGGETLTAAVDRAWVSVNESEERP